MGMGDLAVTYSPLTIPQPGKVCVATQPGGLLLFEALVRVTDQYTAFLEWYWRGDKKGKTLGGYPFPTISPIGAGDTTFRVEPWNYVGVAKRTAIVISNVPEELGALWRARSGATGAGRP